MTAASIGAAKAGGYARYLESKTITPQLGDYYLTPSGEPTQAPGRWLASADTLARLGIEGEAIEPRDFIALMEGRHPRTGDWLRPEGAGGGRGGGIDVTFSPPKSVSAVWALGDEQARAELETAHAAAVKAAVEHLTRAVPTVRRRYGGEVVEEPAVDLVAAEYRHTTARGVVDGDPPDPQLHSHVVLTSAVRHDGRTVAVASRPVFRSAREVGAYYRSALAAELDRLGYELERETGKEGRYFEIAGVPQGLIEGFSARSREVARAAERFRARWGRPPERGELRRLSLENRRAKTLLTRADLQRAWSETAARLEFSTRQMTRATERAAPATPQRPLEEAVEDRLTARAATFAPGELRAAVLEQSVGILAPQEALALAKAMVAERRVLAVERGLMTTLAVRAKEQAIERRLRELAHGRGGREVGASARSHALAQVAERVGASMSNEQARALEAITGPERVAVLVGPAGTGKGVVIDAAARAEQLSGHSTLGIAVAGSTAQRLARDSPALGGQTLTLDALVARVRRGQLDVGSRTTVYFDEAAMADTARLEQLTEVVRGAGAKLVLIGDAAQLPSIGAGGMFERLAHVARTAELSQVQRTLDPGERRAWANLRAGRSEKAMAHYVSRGRLHMTDSRDEALEHAVRDWARLTEAHQIAEVALISDASNSEIDRLNARAQHYRAERGELGELAVPLPGVHYGIRAGDRVALIDQHREPGRERVENGSRGEVIEVTPAGEVVIEFDVSGHRRRLAPGDLGRVRLAYAQHIHRAQGATVARALVLTGGWQTSKEPAYVEASRARRGTDWYVSREDLGSEGHDADRIRRLARGMRRSRAQTPSLSYRELREADWVPSLDRTIAPARQRTWFLRRRALRPRAAAERVR